MKIQKNELYLGISRNRIIQKYASSGGLVTQILYYLLNNKVIDAALVSRVVSKNYNLKTNCQYISNRKNLLLFSGSSYVNMPIMKSFYKRLSMYNKIAIVALPCQIEGIKKFLNRNPELKKKVYVLISLFCHGNSSIDLYRFIFRKFKIPENNIYSIKIKRKYIKGNLIVLYNNGENKLFPFEILNAYRICGCFAMNKCLYCTDHFGFQADISVGDIYDKEFRNSINKYSSFICRTEKSVKIIKELYDKSKINLVFYGWSKYNSNFQKLINFDNNNINRYIAMKIFRLNMILVREDENKKINPFIIISWMIFYFFYKVSFTRSGYKALLIIDYRIILFISYVKKFLSKI